MYDTMAFDADSAMCRAENFVNDCTGALKETHHLLSIVEPIESILHHTCTAIVSYFSTTDKQCIRDTNQPYNLAS